MSLPNAPTSTILLLAPLAQETATFVAVLETTAQRVLWTESVDEALQLAQTWRPELVLVDVATAEGIEDACRRLLSWRVTADDQFCPVAVVAPEGAGEAASLAHLGVDDVVWRSAPRDEVTLRLALLTRLAERYNRLAHRTREAQAAVRHERTLRRRAEALEAMTAVVLAEASPDGVGQRLAEAMVSGLRADGGIVYVVDGPDGAPRILHVVGRDDFVRLAHQGALERVLPRLIEAGRTRQLMVDDDAAGEPWAVLGGSMLKGPGRPGAVLLARRGDAFFGSHEIRLFDQMMERASRAMRNARLDAQTERALQAQTQSVRELQHQVRNNLQAMSALLSFQLMTRPPGPQGVKSTLRRIRGMAAVQDMTFQYPGDTIPLAAIVQRVAAEYAATRAEGQQVEVALDLDGEGLTAERAQVVSLVLEELVANACDHGLRDGAGIVRLAASRGVDGVTLAVEDSGGHLPPNFDIQSLSGSGLHLAHVLLEREFRVGLTVVAATDMTRLWFVVPWEGVSRASGQRGAAASPVACSSEV